MSRPANKPHRLARAVVSSPDRIREWAAWEFLRAVGELFLERLEELQEIGEEFAFWLDVDPEAVDSSTDDLTNANPPDGLFNLVWKWTAKNNISCYAVDDVAARFAWTGEFGAPRVWEKGPDWPWDMTPSEFMDCVDAWLSFGFYPRPRVETRDEFLARAGKHYEDVVRSYVSMEGGRFKKGPVKREHDHFKYLAAHLVGGYSWAQIANGDTPLNLPRRAERTIAEGARETARLIGIPLRIKPGPRPGSSLRPAAHHVRKSRRR